MSDINQQGVVRESGYRKWRLRHSLWLLAPILGFGYLSFVGFVYCAVRVRERRWTILAVLSVSLTVIGFVLVATWSDGGNGTSTAAVMYVVDLWIVSVLFALVVNHDYLAWHARHELQSPSAVPGRV